MLVFWTVRKLKAPHLRGFATTDRCNFAREHGIVETWNQWNRFCLEAGWALRLKFIENCIDAVFLDCTEFKSSSLARLCDTDRCNFAREHGIGGISWFSWFGWFSWFSWFRLVQLVQLVRLGRLGQMGQMCGCLILVDCFYQSCTL